MNHFFHLTLVCLLCSFLFSCKQLTGEDTGANVADVEQNLIGGLEARSVGEQRFLLSGTVSNGGNSGHLFRLRFELPAGQTLKFYFFISRNFTGGALYSFTRADDGVLTMTIDLNGKSDSRELSVFNNSEVVDVELDIHNDHTDAHLLVWGHSGPHEDAEDCTFDGGCLYNSEDFAFDVWLGVGRASGTFWGIQGDQSLILLLEGPLPAISNA